MKPEQLKIGQVISFTPNDQGGWYLLFARDSNCRRYRANAKLFPNGTVSIGAIVSFLPDDSTSGSKKRLPRILKVISAPQPDNQR
jgi:hypothetical protein